MENVLTVNVHVCSFFAVFCFPAAGVGPSAAARGLTAERGRTRLCRGSRPLPPCPPAQEPPLGSRAGPGAARFSGSPRSPRRWQAPAASTRTGVPLVHCDDAGGAEPTSCFVSAIECRLWPCHLRQVLPRAPEQENGEIPLFPQEYVRVFPPD